MGKEAVTVVVVATVEAEAVAIGAAEAGNSRRAHARLSCQALLLEPLS